MSFEPLDHIPTVGNSGEFSDTTCGLRRRYCGKLHLRVGLKGLRIKYVLDGRKSRQSTFGHFRNYACCAFVILSKVAFAMQIYSCANPL